MRPGIRPQFFQDPGPSNFLNLNQYPQNHPQNRPRGPFKGPSSHHINNAKRRDRARPRSQYSFYSDDSSHSNYSNNALIGMGRGSGFVQPSTNFPPHGARSIPNDRRQFDENRNHKAFMQRPPDVPSIRPFGNTNERNLHNNYQRQDPPQSRIRQEQHDECSQDFIYFCPKCGLNYNTKCNANRYIGRLPLILQCHHTMCQECIYQGLKNYKVNCATCLTDSTIAQEQAPVCQSDMQKVFQPNFHIIGLLSYNYKTAGNYLKNLENISFVPTKPQKKVKNALPDPSELCCLTTCSKEAAMFCPSCESIYCSDCCTVVHKSAKNLMSHEPVPRRKQKFTLMLENCGEHPTMQVEYYCITCALSACCYCVLDKHTDHERVTLYHLEDAEMEEFKKHKKVAEKVLREVLATQKKTTKLVNFDTSSVKKDICKHFADCYAKLQGLEKKLCDELESFKANNRGLDAIQASLMASAQQLKQLVAFNENKIGDKKLNLRGALDKLRNLENIRRFLLNEDGQSEPIRFVVNSLALSHLEDDFIIEKSDDSEFRLVTETELPADYVIDIGDSDTEIEEAMSVIDTEVSTGPTTKPDEITTGPSFKLQKRSKTKEQPKRKLDMERIDVQHINSMDSFYIQVKNNQSKLVKLNQDIEDYVKMGGAQAVEEPTLHNLYLALYVNESHGHKEQKWCRARLTNIKAGENGPDYEVFYIDYGKTQCVGANRIRDIPSVLAQKQPFAIECMLYNPMDVKWNKRAHYSLAKILNGKDVYMIKKSCNGGVDEIDLMIASSDGGVTSVTDILVHAHNSVDPLDDVSTDGSIITKREVYYPLLRVFSNSQTFKKNEKHKVTIATVVDPYNIFIHMVQYQEAFKALAHSLKKAFKTSRPCIPIEGNYVIVEHKDPVRMNYHRAFIKSMDVNTDTVQVLLVDWGLNVIVSSNSVRPLQESFTKLESQAVLVKLAHIAPYNKQLTWSPYAANFLQVYFKSQDALKMVIHDVENEPEVALFDIHGNVDLCLNAMMVDNNLADSTGPISTKFEWPQFTIPNQEYLEDDGLMSTLLKKVDEDASYDSEEEDLTNVEKSQIDVINVESPDAIWVKFLDSKKTEREMFKELQVHYSQEQIKQRSWQVDDICVTEMGHEYVRGKIKNIIGQECEIYLLDKVTKIVSPIDKIYKYDQYFTKYPEFAIKSRLAFIKPAGDTGNWSISSIEALQQIFSKHKRIYSHKVPEYEENSSKSLPLDLWYGLVIQGGPLEPDRMKYISINNSLVKLGFAYKIPRPVITESPIKKSSAAEDLLKSLINKLDLQDLNDEENATGIGSVEPISSMDADVTIKTPAESTKIGAKLGIGALRRKGRERSPAKRVSNKLKGSKVREKKEVRKESSRTENQVITLDTTEVEAVVAKSTEDQPKEKEEKNTVATKDPISQTDSLVNAIVENESGPADTAEDVSEGNTSEESPYHKSEVAIDDWLPAFRLTRKDFKARITCVETGGHLYLHDEGMDDVYYKMEANIKEYFDGHRPEITDHRWEPGNLCTIMFTDGNWYRGKILKIKSKEEISVFMIDFGSDHIVSPDVLFREVLYTDIGAFATKVKLDKVYSKSGSWLTSDYDHFHDLVTDWCRIVVKGPIDVQLPLVEVYNESGVLVNEKLIELCPNLSRCSNIPILENVDDDDDVVVIESIESEESSIDEMVMESFNKELDSRKPLKKIPVAQELDIQQPYLAGSGAVKQYKPKPLPKALIEGQSVQMEIGGVLNYNKLLVRLTEDDLCDEIVSLIRNIQDVEEQLPNLEEFVVGMPCIAQFSEDDVWYRARVTDISSLPLGFVSVTFVDYGNSESVKTEQVKFIPLEYLNVPQQVWEVTVNVELVETTDVVSVVQLMNSLERKMRNVKLINENPLVVDLYDKNHQLCYQTFLSLGTLKPLLEDNK